MGKKRKLKVEFDESNRREFLLGFHKRKDIRRKVAKQKLAEKIKEQRKAIRTEKRSQNPQPSYVFPTQVEDLVSTVTRETIDLPTHSVTVTSLEDLELAQKDLYLGRNVGVPEAVAQPEVVPAPETVKSRGKHFRAYSRPTVADPKKLKSLEKMFKKVKGTKKGRKNPHYKPPAKPTKAK